MTIRKLLFLMLGLLFLTPALGSSDSDSLRSNRKSSELYNEMSESFLASNPDSSLFFAQKALAQPNCKAALSHCNLGLAYSALGKKDSATFHLKKSLGLYKKENSIAKLALLYKHIGEVFYKYDINDSAIVYFEQALPLYEKSTKNKLYLKLLYSIAKINSDKYKYSEALNYLHKLAKEATKQNDTLQLGYSHHLTGSVFQATKKFHESLKHFQQAETFFRITNFKQGIITSVYNQAHILKDLKQYEDALVQTKKCLAMFEELDLASNVEIARLSVASIYNELEQYDNALEYLNKVKSSLKEPNSKKGISLYFYYGNAFYGLRKYNEALLHYQKSIGIADTIHQEFLVHKVWKAATKAFIQTGQKDKAVQSLDRYAILSDSAFQKETQKQIEVLEAKRQTLEKERQIEKLDTEKRQQELQIANERQKFLLTVIAALLIVVIGSAMAILYRNRQKIKNEQLAQKKAKLESSLLRTQMNPHFIFNSLNSINNFVQSNKAEDAGVYLTKFARLMRLILDHSSQDYVQLDEEIEALKLYLELEQQRFGKSFDFKIEVDEEIEEEFMEIPPMLSQPFVENALIHGLSQLKDRKGSLKIEYQLSSDEKSVKCTVRDNGIGRKASAEINSSRTKAHKSKGILISQERLKMLNEEGQSYSVKVTDLFDESTPNGTKVELDLPLKN